ncbi:MAG: HEPN domain-containing protein [Pseudomonadales bacterium]
MTTSILQEKLRNLRENMPEAHAVRLHRAISWLLCAEEQKNNHDLQFISLWIAFNACYSIDEEKHQSIGERDTFQRFMHKLVKHDKAGTLHQTLMQTYSGSIRTLISNQYVFAPFWEAQRLLANHQKDTTEWKTRFDKASKTALLFLMEKKVPELLGVVLDRLYVLRNQLMHGGATWNSQVNRQQVKDGCSIMLTLMPIIISTMLEANEENWGEIFYPVVK